ncbi:MAG: MerR family transcriptional regulator [Marinifilaceae bacterium]|jgi:DNA-binding transcriptional MerR regulator|nr:MerR family transcriptional regulator [Marinifilaceae bacterium]
MKIGILSKKTGLSRDTIRYYEKMGLLLNISQNNEYNNYKDYGEENIKRLEYIQLMKKFGLKLKECKLLLDKIEANEFDQNYQRELIINRINDIDNRINELNYLKKILFEYIDKKCDKL